MIMSNKTYPNHIKERPIKWLLLCVLMIAFMGSTFAQAVDDSVFSPNRNNEPKTIFKPGRKQGFYGAMSMGYAPMHEKDGFTVSARGTWLIDRSFGIGFGGTGFINNIGNAWDWANMAYAPNDQSITGGYGGIVLEPVLLPRWPVHLSFPVLLGVGAADTFSNLYYSYYHIGNVFLIAEPHVELEFNLTRFAKFALYGSYRFTTDVTIKDVPCNVLQGYSAGMILKIGWFQ
jgi:hypothetical protein